MLVVLLLTGLGFGRSYLALAPLAGSESPESLLLLVPFAAAVVLWRRLARAPRDGAELTVNLILATPALLLLLGLLVWLPARLSYFYWVYRLDLLAVPLFVAVAVLLVFGANALWRAKLALGVLLLGWPPLLDRLLQLVTEPASSLQARVLGLLPLPGSRVGETFFLEHGRHAAAITIAAPCSGLLGVFSMMLVGGLVAHFAHGPRRRKLAWLASAVVLALVVNVARLALVLLVASWRGVDAGFALFHALAGPVLFAAVLLVSLRALARFGVELRPAAPAPVPRPVELRLPTAVVVTAIVALLALIAAWTTSAAGAAPGLFRDAAAVSSRDLLPPPAGFHTSSVESMPSLATLFGRDALAGVYHLRAPGGRVAGAQVVVVPTYDQARRYDVLRCFVFHDDSLYATHVTPLARGGTGLLTSLRLDRRDVATLSWIQPVLLDGHRAWRRVVLFAYLSGARPTGSFPGGGGAISFGSWLVDHIGPYGGSEPPPRFRPVERGLVQLADGLVR